MMTLRDMRENGVPLSWCARAGQEAWNNRAAIISRRQSLRPWI